MATLGNVDIFVRSRPGVDPYFNLSMSDPPVRWQEVWFFLRKNANAPLPVFTGCHNHPPIQMGVLRGPKGPPQVTTLA
jgi:hypothetical protein